MSIIYYNDVCTCEHAFSEHEECGNPDILNPNRVNAYAGGLVPSSTPICHGKPSIGTRCLCEKFTSTKDDA